VTYNLRQLFFSKMTYNLGRREYFIQSKCLL